MPKQVTEELESRTQQSENSKRATFDRLKNKPRAEREVVLRLPNDEGGHDEMSMLFRAIGSQEYDKLLTKNPPSQEQKADGGSYNVNTFGPALLSRVCIEPDMDQKQWAEIWNSPDWNRGEMMQLFLVAVELCNRGLDIPLSETD
jgi:hypothetical protein